MPNKIKDAFELISADEGIKERTKGFIAQSYTPTSKKRILHRRLVVSASALALAFVLGIVGFAVYFTPVSVISIDINPSVELSVNRFDTVIGTAAYNDEGKELLKRVDLRFKSYNDAIDCVLDDDSVEGYIENEQVVCITVIEENEARRKHMVDKLCTKAENDGIYVESENKAAVHHAHKSGMSYGKYNAYLKAKSENAELTEEDAAKLSMREMYEMMGHGKGEHGQGRPNGNNKHDGIDTELSFDEPCEDKEHHVKK